MPRCPVAGGTPSLSRAAVVALTLGGLLAGSIAFLAYRQGAQDPNAKRERSGAATQRIVYLVEDRSSSPVRLTTQVLDVAPPYTARLMTFEGPPPGAGSLGGLAWDVARQYLIEPGGAVKEIQQVPPGFAGIDAHLDIALPTALRLRLVERGGAVNVAGVACRDWLSKEPLDSGVFAPPTMSDRAVTCVDTAGRILRDEWTLRGRLVRVRTAISVGAGPALTARALFSGMTPNPAPTGFSSESVKDVSVPRLAQALGIVAPRPPPGLAVDRSVALIDVDRTGIAPRIVNEGAAISWTDGRRLVVLLIKRGLNGAIPPPRGGVLVAVPGLGTGRLTPTLSGIRLQLLTSRGLLVTVTGDIPEAALLEWVRLLRLG